MNIEQLSFVIESMFPGIIGGKDYLLQASVNEDGTEGNDAKIIAWNMPIKPPTDDQLNDFFLQVEDEYEKLNGLNKPKEDDDERRKRIVDSFLGSYGN